MSSAKIIRFPRVYRCRPLPPMRHNARPYLRPDPGGFGLMMFLTVPAAALYLSKAIDVARHDILYTALLVSAWGLYFLYPLLLKVPVLGPLLIRACQLLLAATVIGCFGGIYWLIFRNG